MKALMKPGHPQWEEFVDKLAGSDGLDVRETKGHEIVSLCDGDEDRPVCRKILAEFKDIDIEGSLELFIGYGAYCDCEVLFNVE